MVPCTMLAIAAWLLVAAMQDKNPFGFVSVLVFIFAVAPIGLAICTCQGILAGLIDMVRVDVALKLCAFLGVGLALYYFVSRFVLRDVGANWDVNSAFSSIAFLIYLVVADRNRSEKTFENLS